jgi:hypothetical protein
MGVVDVEERNLLPRAKGTRNCGGKKHGVKRELNHKFIHANLLSFDWFD